MTSRNILKSTAIAFTISIGLASAALAECNFEGETITIVVPFGEEVALRRRLAFSSPIFKNTCLEAH